MSFYFFFFVFVNKAIIGCFSDVFIIAGADKNKKLRTSFKYYKPWRRRNYIKALHIRVLQ